MNFKAKFEEIRDEVLERGGSYRDMAEQACDLVKRSGMVDEFFAAYGVRCLIHLFSYEIRADRRVQHDDEHEPATPGQRKVTPAINDPRSVLNVVFTVGGRPVRLGDVTIKHADVIASEYTERGSAMLRRAEFFRKIARRLRRENASTVRAAFKGKLDDLVTLYRRGLGDE